MIRYCDARDKKKKEVLLYVGLNVYDVVVPDTYNENICG